MPENKENFQTRLPNITTDKIFGMKILENLVSSIFFIVLVLIVLTLLLTYFVKIDIAIDAKGILEPSIISDIHMPESGSIKKLFINSGDTISIGTTIAILDSTDLKKSLEEINTEIFTVRNRLNKLTSQNIFDKQINKYQLKQAQAKLIKAKATFRDRLTKFYFKPNLDSIYNNYKLGTNITIDYSMAEIISTEAEIKTIELKNEMQKIKEFDSNEIKFSLDNLLIKKKYIINKLNNLVILSPISGIILTEDINKLQGMFFAKGDYFLSIGKSNKWLANLFIKETDIHKIKINDKVKINLQALKNTNKFEFYNASIISISSEKIKKNGKYSSFFDLYRVSAIIIDNNLDTLKLKYGYNVNGSIITERKSIINIFFDNIIK